MTLIFFLGGHDLEMLSIRSLIAANASPAQIIDHNLPWHSANASAYQQQINDTLNQGNHPVLIELNPDIEQTDQCTLVDHHGTRAGKGQPTSLEQIFNLLELPATMWTRELQLIAANDRGWIPEMRAMGATPDEVVEIRKRDRNAQGISTWEEQSALKAINNAEWLNANLVVVTLPHSKTAPVSDHLAITHTTPPDTLIVSPDEVNFSGNGKHAIRLDQDFPGGWLGGALPDFGFWGKNAPLPAKNAILNSIQNA